MNNKTLFRISRYAYKEIFLQGTLDQQGFQQAKLLERLEKNSKYLKQQEIALKIIIGIYITGMVALPITIFIELEKAFHSELSKQWLLMAGTITLGLFFLIQMLYVLIFGMFFASSLLSGECMHWLTTLPLSKEDLRKIIFFTFFRVIDVQLIVMIFVLPIATAIVTHNPLLTIFSAFGSIMNIFFTYSLLILIGQKINRIMRLNDVNSRKNNLLRIATLIGYVLLTISIAVGLQFAIQSMFLLFSEARLTDSSLFWLNILIGLVPFPFNSSYIMIEIMLGNDYLDYTNIISSLLGLIFQIKLVQLLYKKAKKSLDDVYIQTVKSTTSQSEQSKKLTIEEIQIKSSNPIQAFYNKDKQMATRDIQLMMLIIMPIILPIITSFSMVMSAESEPMAYLDWIMTSIIMGVMFQVMGAMMMVLGMLNIESTGHSIMASLPIRTRDQALAKLRFPYRILPIASLIAILMSVGSPALIPIIIINLLIIPFGLLLATGLLELKVALFGKMQYKYVLEEIHFEHKILKWFFIILLSIGIYIGMMVGSILIFESQIEHPLWIFASVMIGLIVVFIIITKVIFDKMFPK